MKVRHTSELDFSASELEKANQRIKELEILSAKSSGLVSPHSASETAPDPPSRSPYGSRSRFLLFR